MNKNPFVRLAHLALGCVLLFAQGGCADDNNHVVQANNELGGTHQISPANDVSHEQAQNGQPASFTDNGR